MVKVRMVPCPPKPPESQCPVRSQVKIYDLQHFKPFVQNEYMLSNLVVIAFYNSC